ncbi:MAG: exodeoxyribonuclease V subunit gamma, partial [Dokdonella sp.]
QREVLRWRIHDLLGSIDDAQVASYLTGEDVPRRRFQLADRLAKIFSQYLVYRADWLQEWAQGRSGPADSGFLAPLWRALREAIAVPHRGERLGQLIARLKGASVSMAATEPLHVFGVSHLAPSELAVLRAVATHRLVVLYVPDPCREYWGGLRDDRQRLLDLLKREPEAGEGDIALATEIETVFLQQDHPLLASWGRLGQHFLLSLADSDARIDERHWQDQLDAAVTGNRLQRVQESVRQLLPALIGATQGDPRTDRSLRIHACHTRLRELEVLRDALLRERADDPSLKPSDIIVTMPNVQDYLPLLPSVFGEAGKHGGALPYHLADVAVARAHPLFAAFRQLLAVPFSRITAPEVVDLLRIPQIAQRLNVRENDIDVLTNWLENSRVAWGLDGPFRERFDAPPIAEHTFAWGMDRMLAGYVMGTEGGDEPSVLTLPDKVQLAPLEGIHGPQAVLLGALDRLLLELAAWSAFASSVLPASDWSERLEQRFESLFQIDPTDRDARDVRSQILGFIRAIASEPADSELDPPLHFSVVREVLLGRLGAVASHQRFLMGGMTICGMVPQRAVPFRVVAVLGLNDGEYPRASSDGGLDLMLKHPRLGDRNQRSDDRYLFLETLMSARDVLHLSYVGEGIRDGKPRNPATPLAELMTVLDQSAGVAHDAPDALKLDDGKIHNNRPWLVRHPLQPFDQRYFDGGDEALFSFRRDFAEMQNAGDAVASVPFVATTSFDASFIAESDSTIVPLRALQQYYKDPAKHLLVDGVGLRLDALSDERLRSSEALDASVDALDGIARRLFVLAAVRNDRVLDETAPDWLRLSGMLPPARAGVQAWSKQKGLVDALLESVAEHPLFIEGLPEAIPQRVDLVVGSYRVQGDLARVHESAGTRWVMVAFPGKKLSALDFKARIDVFIEWALLRLLDGDGKQPARVCLVAEKNDDGWAESLNDWDERFMATVEEKSANEIAASLDDLRDRIGALIAFWQASQREPRWYFPKTSWNANAENPAAINQPWVGGFFKGERDYAPGYARVLAGDRDFSDDDDFSALAKNAVHLRALIDLAPEETQ